MLPDFAKKSIQTYRYFFCNNTKVKLTHEIIVFLFSLETANENTSLNLSKEESMNKKKMKKSFHGTTVSCKGVELP